MWSLGEEAGVSEEEHFIHSLTSSGIELHFMIPKPRGDSEYLNDSRIKCHTYTNIFERYRLIPGAIKRFFLPTFFNFTVTPPLLRLVIEIKPDLVIGFSHHSLHPLYRLKQSTGIPTVVKLFGVMYLGRFDLPDLAYKWKSIDQLRALKWPVDHYIVMNDGTQGKKALQRAGIPSGKISMLPNGMNTEWFEKKVDREQTRWKMGLPSRDLLVVTMSRLVKSKRIDLFLRAAYSICKGGNQGITFVIAGDGPEMRNLQRMTEKLNLSKRVIFTGTIPHRRVVEFLKASDIFVGTNELTNMSLPPCEAILCGVPVVAFDVSGTSEVVQEGRNGLLVEHQDVNQLASKIITLAKDNQLREKLSRGAREFGRNHFVSWEECIEMELDILDQIISV
jgi:glycosyltransferase involved in cell wall biosynthesis